MKPILFNGEMTRAILDGRKTQTRRVVKPQPAINAKLLLGKNMNLCHAYDDAIEHPGPNDRRIFMAPYKPGDVLWVRETWAFFGCSGCEGDEQGRCMFPERRLDAKDGCYVYKATDNVWDSDGMKWRPSIHMPREAARIFLRVTDVRVERLWDTQPADICAEGVPIGANDSADMAYESFSALWDSTIKPSDRDCFGWEANPWVFVYTFERCEKEDAE